MELEKLKSAYNGNEIVSAICDHLSERERNQKETKLHRIIRHLNEDGYSVKKPDVIAAFRELETADCGKYIEGRHRHKSRFAWSVKSTQLSHAIKDESSQPQIEEITDQDSSEEYEYESETVEHTFVLRSEFVVNIELPEDLTKSESKRLSRFMLSLPFGE